MARSPFTTTVLDVSGNVKQGASVTIRLRANNGLATVYSAETGAGQLANPLSTDANGMVVGWVDRGTYRADVSGTGVQARSVPFDAAPVEDPVSSPPIGSLFYYVGTSDPAGGNWLVCDGRAISRSTYSTLYGVVGTVFGAGDGVSTFNLPNPQSRMPLTAGGASGLTTRTRGQTGGSENASLAIGNLPDLTVTGDITAGAAINIAAGQAPDFLLRLKSGLAQSFPITPPYLVVGPAIIRVL